MHNIFDTIHIAGEQVRPLSEHEPVRLVCGEAGCASNCCKNGPPIVLNPYEIDGICRASGMSYDDLLDLVETERADGFPLILLPRDPQCAFWTGRGCRVHGSRPLACRLFPFGRVFERGVSHIILPERNRCEGLAAGDDSTLADYLNAQDTKTYIAMADLWIAFVSAMEERSLPDRPVTSVAFHMLVYHPDAPPAPASPDQAPEERFRLKLAAAAHALPLFLKLS